MNIAAHAVIVQARFVVGRSFVDTANRSQFAVVHLNEAARIPRSLFFGRGNRDNRIADEAHVVRTQRVLVLADGQDPERRRHVLTGQDALHARQRRRLRGIDVREFRVRHGAAQQLHVQHARHRQVVGELRQPADFAAGIDLADWLANVLKLALLFIVLPRRVITILGRHGVRVLKSHRSTPCSVRRLRRACAPPPTRSLRRSSGSQCNGTDCRRGLP